MNPGYARIRLPQHEAMSRFSAWIGLTPLEPPRRTDASRAVREACENGQWRGVAVFVHEASGWTVFDDLTGHLSATPAARWLELAQKDELVFAEYNDAIGYGAMIAVREGTVTREFLDNPEEPAENVDIGRLDFETESPIESWIGVASFVDEDRLSDAGAPDGLLWIFR